MMKLGKHTSHLRKASTESSSIRTTLPKKIIDDLELGIEDTITWEVFHEKGKKYARVEKLEWTTAACLPDDRNRTATSWIQVLEGRAVSYHVNIIRRAQFSSYDIDSKPMYRDILVLAKFRKYWPHLFWGHLAQLPIIYKRQTSAYRRCLLHYPPYSNSSPLLP